MPNSEENCCETYFEKISWSKIWRLVPILSTLYVSKPLEKCLLSQLFLTILTPLSTHCSTETALLHVFSELWLPEIVARSQLAQITHYTQDLHCVNKESFTGLHPVGQFASIMHEIWKLKPNNIKYTHKNIVLVWYLILSYIICLLLRPVQVKTYIIGRFYIALFSALEQTHCARMWFYMSE